MPFKNFYFNVKRIHPNAKLPTKSYEDDAGYDLYAIENTIIYPGGDALIKFGFKTEFPGGFVAVIHDRGSVAKKLRLHVKAGIIDAPYRGEWFGQVENHNSDFVHIKAGQKVLQFIVYPIWNGKINDVEELSDTERGEGKLGSSGE
jgi:dUTP pyrophosphatase